MEPREVTIKVPLSITVTIGEETSFSENFSEQITPIVSTEAARPTSYYQGYKGYERDFLDVPRRMVLWQQQQHARARAADSKSAPI